MDTGNELEGSVSATLEEEGDKDETVLAMETLVADDDPPPSGASGDVEEAMERGRLSSSAMETVDEQPTRNEHQQRSRSHRSSRSRGHAAAAADPLYEGQNEEGVGKVLHFFS